MSERHGSDDDNQIDFSTLDPSREAARWQRRLDATLARALSRRRSRSVPAQLVAWARPSLAMAAALALAVWMGALSGAGATDDRDRVAYATEASAPTALLSDWAGGASLPSTAVILETFGTPHE